MNFTLHNWLLAQCDRDSAVGEFAREWLSASSGTQDLLCEVWIKRQRENILRRSTVEAALNEFSEAEEFLSRGESAPTFPKHFASDDYEKELSNSFSRHRANSNISTNDYLRIKHEELQRFVSGKTLIYLDTNHWVNLRHVCLESRHATDAYSEIYHSIRSGVNAGRVLCPISFPLFVELMKQSDKDTRLATARLMDELSLGVCLLDPDELGRSEIRTRFLATVSGQKSAKGAGALWTKAGYLGGTQVPSSPAFSDADNTFLQKVSIDGMWSVPLEHIAELDATTPNGSIFHNKDYFHQFASAMNQDAAWYRSNGIGFSDALAREKGFLVRSIMEEFEEIAKEIWDEYPQYRDFYLRNQTDGQKPDPFALPPVQVRAGINAALLVLTKKFSANDMLDFQHAALAVPYYDALFCDGPMSHVLRAKPLSFDQVYKTKILSRPDQILPYLRTLVGHSI